MYVRQLLSDHLFLAGTRGEEDYRWPLLRQRMSRITWEIFTLVFIATIQNILLAATAVSAKVGMPLILPTALTSLHSFLNT